MTTARQTTVRQRLLAVIVAGLGSAVAAAVSFAMSIYEAANPAPLPVVASGQSIDTGRWLVAVHSASITDVPPTGTPPIEPKTFLAVELDVDNRSAATSHVSGNLLAIDPPVPGLPDPTFYLSRDRWIAGGVNPGMPERMVAVWEWPAAQEPPRSLRLLIGSQLYKRRDNLYGASGWFDRDPVAVVELPVAAAPVGAAR